MGPSEPMIRVHKLHRNYGATRALRGIDFELQAGEILGFLGPNGAGKTSTLKVLSGGLAPSEGEAFVAGHPAGSSQAREALGYLPEQAPVYPEMRVGEYLAHVAAMRGLPRGRREAAIELAVERCGLDEVRRKTLGALSKGYRQRVGLAQAILHEPAVLILDEPSSGLDPNQRVEIRELVKRLGERATIIFSSHVLAEVEAVADRVIILDRGLIVADDSPARLFGQDGARLLVQGAEEVTLREALASVQGVSEVQLRKIGPAIEARVRGAEPPALARAVLNGGWDLLELGPAGKDLEAVFRQLTEPR